MVAWIRRQFLDTEIDCIIPQLYKIVVSLNKTLYPQCFSQLVLLISTIQEHPCDGCFFSAMSSQDEIAIKDKHFFIVPLHLCKIFKK